MAELIKPIFGQDVEDKINNKLQEIHNKLDSMGEQQLTNHGDILKNLDEINKFTLQVNGVLDKYQNAIDIVALYLEFTIPINNLRSRLSQQNLYLELIMFNKEQDKQDMYLDTILSLPWYKRIFMKQRKRVKDEINQRVEEIYQDNIESIKNKMKRTTEQLEILQKQEKEVRERMRKAKEQALKEKTKN